MVASILDENFYNLEDFVDKSLFNSVLKYFPTDCFIYRNKTDL